MFNFNFVFLVFVQLNVFNAADMTWFAIIFHPFVLRQKHTESFWGGCICEDTRPRWLFNRRVKKLVSRWRRDGGLCFQVRWRSRAGRWMSCLWSCRSCGRAVKSISGWDTMRFSCCATERCWMSRSFQPLKNVLRAFDWNKNWIYWWLITLITLYPRKHSGVSQTHTVFWSTGSCVASFIL